MTTSSSRALPEVAPKPKPRKRVVVPPRYYRCRGGNACRGTQVGADSIERRVLAWLRKPVGDLSPEAQFVLARFAPLWDVLIPQVEHALVNQLVWEVQWDGRRDTFTVMLDDAAIAEEHAKLLRSDAERANRPKPPRRRKAKRGRARAR